MPKGNTQGKPGKNRSSAAQAAKDPSSMGQSGAAAADAKSIVVGSMAGKTVSAILGEITWLMSQSPKHKMLMIADLETRVMPAVLLRQFRIYYEKAPVPMAPVTAAQLPGMPPAPAAQGNEVPVGCIIYARVNDETAARLDAGVPTLRPQDWASGPAIRIIDHIAPFGGVEQMVKEFGEMVR
jgi:cytolysin-activating lysine-acyltransferase